MDQALRREIEDLLDSHGLTVRFGSLRNTIKEGTGSPAGVVTGTPGDLYLNRTGGATTTLYVKETGIGTTAGWVAK